jgi:uncharacterized protein (DUF1800 family)
MTDYLSYRANKAYAFAGTYPDENYAREIMQLFSIGLWELNPDGTTIKDQTGDPVATYTNEDIVDFARIFTGFDRQSSRSNIEQPGGSSSANYIDVSQIKPLWRDLAPKAKLGVKGHIGKLHSTRL